MYKSIFKRGMDILICVMALPLFAIFFMVVAAAIKLDDGGPVLYCGERVGERFKTFKMYKFRSMKVNSPDQRNEDGSTFNARYDARLTRVGKYIREWSIDEIPQILNVLKGDMSLIGPRPSPCGNMHLYSKAYLRKFSVKPGITGYAQAIFRNSIPPKEKERYDLYYIDHLSFVLDMRILFKTVSTILMRKGVYGKDHRTFSNDC